ncbi:DUF445 domain-containing protein [Aquabacter sp. CN5-332]|uniref:DUF445 domain-containing protein n=1 Tax=Aquabacter sp. CN5-332 TaxID=3156608 RepID=UPI0032B43DDB
MTDAGETGVGSEPENSDYVAAAARRLWWTATGLLALVTATFVFTVRWPDLWSGMPYLRAFCEAAMVGACADWFAVVALFRHPLGIPIPHTAIIPRHKQRVAAAMGRFVSNNFLAPEHIATRLERFDAAGLAADWLKQPHNVLWLKEQSRNLVPPLLDLLGDKRLRSFAGAAFRQGVDSIDVASLSARTLSVLVRNGYHNEVFDRILMLASAFMHDHQDGIREQVASKGVRWLPGWVDNKLADAFIAEVLRELEAARAQDHPWRRRFQQEISHWISLLSSDEEMPERMERIKSEVLSSSVVDGYVDWLGNEMEERLRADIAKPDGLFAARVEDGVVALAAWLEAEPHMRETLNRGLRQWVVDALVPNRAEVGRFITETVERWDTQTLVEKIETQVGKDLQYIRVNGTLVGGLIGLAIFTVSRWLAP